MYFCLKFNIQNKSSPILTSNGYQKHSKSSTNSTQDIVLSPDDETSDVLHNSVFMKDSPTSEEEKEP